MLEFYFIAHPHSGSKEGKEERRVMFYTPKDGVPILKQAEVTGFAEAVVNFTQNFAPRAAESRESIGETEKFSYRDVVTKKTVHVYVVIENAEFIFGMALNRKICAELEYPIFAPALRSIVEDSYKMFRLFFGEITPLLQEEESFRERLEYFFSRYLSQLRVYQMPLLDYFLGVHFVPLQGPVFLDIDALLSELKEHIVEIRKVLFLYGDKLLYYSVSKRDLPSVYRYLIQNIVPTSMRSELSLASDKEEEAAGNFLHGPDDLRTDEPIGEDDKFPTVHLYEPDGKIVPHNLVAYRSLSATVCAFVQEDVNRQLLRRIDKFLSVELEKLASVISRNCSKLPPEVRSGETDFHYIYYNPLSLSLRSSFYDSTTTQGTPPVPTAVYRLACDAYDKLLRSGESVGDCSLRAESEWWVVIKKAAERILLLFLPSTNLSNLAELQNRVNQIVNAYFKVSGDGDLSGASSSNTPAALQANSPRLSFRTSSPAYMPTPVPAPSHSASGNSLRFPRATNVVASVFNGEEDDDPLAGKKKLKLFEITQEERIRTMTPGEIKKLQREVDEIFPQAKEALFVCSIAWNLLEKAGAFDRIQAWVGKKIKEYIGEDEPSLVSFISEQLRNKETPEKVKADLTMVLDDESEVFVAKLWRLVVYESECASRGIPTSSSMK